MEGNQTEMGWKLINYIFNLFDENGLINSSLNLKALRLDFIIHLWNIIEM